MHGKSSHYRVPDKMHTAKFLAHGELAFSGSEVFKWGCPEMAEQNSLQFTCLTQLCKVLELFEDCSPACNTDVDDTDIV